MSDVMYFFIAMFFRLLGFLKWLGIGILLFAAAAVLSFIIEGQVPRPTN